MSQVLKALESLINSLQDSFKGDVKDYLLIPHGGKIDKSFLSVVLTHEGKKDNGVWRLYLVDCISRKVFTTCLVTRKVVEAIYPWLDDSIMVSFKEDLEKYINNPYKNILCDEELDISKLVLDIKPDINRLVLTQFIPGISSSEPLYVEFMTQLLTKMDEYTTYARERCTKKGDIAIWEEEPRTKLLAKEINELLNYLIITLINLRVIR